MKLLIPSDSTSRRIAIKIRKLSDGTALTGLVFNSASLVWYYWREDEGNVNATAVTMVTATRGTYTSSGFIEKDATNMPGFYELGIPDAALATGSNWVVMRLGGFSDMEEVEIEIQLDVLNAADVQQECEDALDAKGLDHLLSAAVAGADVTDNSVVAQLVSKSATADWDDYDNTTDSLQAAVDNGLQLDMFLATKDS